MSLMGNVALGIFVGVGIGAEILNRRADKNALEDALREAESDDDDDGGDDDGGGEPVEDETRRGSNPPSAIPNIPPSALREMVDKIGSGLPEGCYKDLQTNLLSWEKYLLSGIDHDAAVRVRGVMALSFEAGTALKDGSASIPKEHAAQVLNVAIAMLREDVKKSSIGKAWQESALKLCDELETILGEK